MIVLPRCVYVYHMHAWCPQSQEDAIIPLELELQACVSCVVGAGNLGPLYDLLLPSHLSSSRRDLLRHLLCPSKYTCNIYLFIYLQHAYKSSFKGFS